MAQTTTGGGTKTLVSKHNMSTLTVGQILTGTHQKDAIHVAIAPVKALQLLRPSDRVSLTSQGLAYHDCNNTVGIVDPFLQKYVEPGQTFWLFLLPNTAQNLRHEWDHPAFQDKTKQEDTEEDDYGCRGC